MFMGIYLYIYNSNALFLRSQFPQPSGPLLHGCKANSFYISFSEQNPVGYRVLDFFLGGGVHLKSIL